MRRFGQWTVKGLTVLSLVLCVATATMWLLSRYRSDWFYWANASRRFCVVSGGGEVFVEEVWDSLKALNAGWGQGSYSAASAREIFTSFAAGADTFGRHAGFSRASAVFVRSFAYLPRNDGFRMVGVPYWFLFLLTSLLPATRIGRAVRSRRRRLAGGCAICHYDLTGNLSGVCPECGTSVAGS